MIRNYVQWVYRIFSFLMFTMTRMNMENLVGTNLGRYHIIEPLGEGGMASVYKAYDTNLERNVAIKVIRIEKGQDEAFLKRFRREAKSLAKVLHPNIVAVHDFGEQDGIPYLVMDYLAGGTLKQKMGHAMPYQEAAQLLAPIARALEYAHKQGIIHRDVKPANILMTDSGIPMLTDFGIAKILEAEEATHLTGTGVGIGTPDYMAPEQGMGTLVDRRADIYALGIVFYELIVGRRPYVADTPFALVLKHINDPLPRPKVLNPNIPDAVEQVIFKALAKKPEDRYQDMGEFASKLEKLAQNNLTGIEFVNAETILSSSPIGEMTVPISRRTAASTILEPSQASFPSVPVKKGRNWMLIGGIGLIVVVLIGVCLATGAYLAFQKPGAKVQSTQSATVQNGIIGSSNQTAKTPPVSTAAGLSGNIPTQVTETKFTPTVASLTHIEGLPTDIPIIQPNNGDLISQNSQGTQMFMFTTTTSTKEARDYYLAAMAKAGYTLVNTVTMAAQDMYNYTFQKDTKTYMIVVLNQNDKTMIQIMITAQ
jgi:serine/threonine protein kinase